MHSYKRAITPSQFLSVLFLFLCFRLSVSVSICVSPWPSLLSPSLSLGWSLFLLPPSSFLILFISRRDAPQRHSAELSDLNKCLRLEPGLSCGLGCTMWETVLESLRCAVAWQLNESLSKPPRHHSSSSVCRSQFVVSIFNGLGDVRKAPASISVLTNKILEDGYFLSQWLLFGCRLDVKTLGISYSLYNTYCQIQTPVSMISRFIELLKQSGQIALLSPKS